MELRQLITFSKITEMKSFLKAAENLGYAQSTITTQVQLLEKELGIKLFERIGRNMELTSKGLIFLEYAEKIINLANEAKEAIDDRDTPKGILKIGVVESLCTVKLPELLKDFHIKYPKVEVIIKIGTCTDLQNMLKNNTVDLIFTLGELIKDPDLISCMCYDEEMAILASPLNKLKDKFKLTLRDIADESLIVTEKGCSYRSVFESMFHKECLQPHLALEIGSIETIKSFVMNNLGITLLPIMTVENELSKGNLVKLDLVDCDFNMMTQILYHRNKWVTPAMDAFIEELKSLDIKK
ncbi:LysR family transcriptional regulator [Clostridium carboxidivorans P7]|uniref:Transcriptional regulator, LysR family n=1 Tax=Clostridium carboxidivorans P7 TaxID=536227 RepID=C6PSG8_9CLOT|nr:LysR family transcriptional regulator [Clostridium carboxidivorans]AKN32575.1 LysR family transcriptional regulator [Clostridium carboxidivorans P7]EET87846.1 transcriptional regulator, LysR family [Clostridium carboxidivorans P7]EFG90217.1 LysR substrate binding domain protein [Clostridium carboxidivorans P7]